MSVQDQIDAYLAGQPQAKREDIQELDRRIRRIAPNCPLWFLDGRNDEGKVVTNPNIGYGAQTIAYANGQTKDFYRVGLSGNTGGISVYILGAPDKTYLAQTYGDRLGKAKVTGYCIRFRSLKDIDIGVLEEAIAGSLGGGWPSAMDG